MIQGSEVVPLGDPKMAGSDRPDSLMEYFPDLEQVYLHYSFISAVLVIYHFSMTGCDACI